MVSPMAQEQDRRKVSEEQQQAAELTESLHALSLQEGAGALVWGRVIADALTSHTEARKQFLGKTAKQSTFERIYGTAYVIDWNTFNREAKDKYAPKVIKTAMVLTGQTITVDAATQTITIGAIGNTTATVFTDKNLSPDHTYEIRLDTTKHWF